MAENQLGLLFGQIADSIRGGLGDIGTMKPASFPEKIDNIVDLIGTGGSGNPVIEPLTIMENGTYTAPDGVDGYSPVTVNVAGGGVLLEEPLVASGRFIPTAETYTLQHNLGVVPDCVMIRNVNFNDGTVPNNCVLIAFCYRTGLRFSKNLQENVVNTDNGCQNVGINLGIETSGSEYGGCRNATATSVVIGGSMAKLDTTAEYEWKVTRITPYE